MFKEDWNWSSGKSWNTMPNISRSTGLSSKKAQCSALWACCRKLCICCRSIALVWSTADYSWVKLCVRDYCQKHLSPCRSTGICEDCQGRWNLKPTNIVSNCWKQFHTARCFPGCWGKETNMNSTIKSPRSTTGSYFWMLSRSGVKLLHS
jgi:hypothetical protein